MKIYEIGTGYTPIPAQMGAATEIVVEELTRSMRSNGDDAVIIDIKADIRQDIELPIIEVGVPKKFTGTDVSLGIMHKLKRVIYSVSLARKLKAILKASDEQTVLHFHNQYNLFFFLKMTSEKLRKKAIIGYTVHSYIWGTEWQKIEDTVKKKYFQEIYCVKNADAVFVLNDITAEHFTLRLGISPDKIHKVMNGVNMKRYAPLPDSDVSDFKKTYGFDGKKVVFQVGSVCERKNQLGSISMLAEYMQNNSDVVFAYAGGIIDSEYQERIKAFAEERGISERVIYLGELAPGETLNRYYNAADCCVFTSTLESFGLVIIEAISSGTPVVVGSNLMFELDGGYEMYRNENEFISAVDKCLNSHASFNGARDVISNTYSWNAVAKDYVSILKSIKNS